MFSVQSELEGTKDLKNLLLQKANDINHCENTVKFISKIIKFIEPLLTIKDIDDNCKIDDILKNTFHQIEHTFEDKSINNIHKICRILK